MLIERLESIVGGGNVRRGEDGASDYTHDEGLGIEPVAPLAVVCPADTAQVASIVRLAGQEGVPISARGSGTGLSGGCVPVPGGLVVSFERMDRVVEIDEANQVAVVQPGITLEQLDAALAPMGFLYPVMPGESSASIGGNVGTNAGGMRAVKHGVTRHHVLGVEAVLGTGEVIRTGGKFVKSSAGYDITQLIVGSEGTLALVTEATLKLQPRPAHSATVLAAFKTLDEVSAAVPPVVSSGIDPSVLEYLDMLTLQATTDAVGMDVGVSAEVREAALAYLLVVLESHHADRLDQDVEILAELLGRLGALEVYVLGARAAGQLIEARERAFFVAKAHGSDDIVDVVVPRAQMPVYLDRVVALARAEESMVAGCGHAGDGNVHLSVFQPDADRRSRLMRSILAAGLELGGAISGEHGIGLAKRAYFLELEDPAKIALMARIKAAFDPLGILNPGKTLAATTSAPSVLRVVDGSEPSR